MPLSTDPLGFRLDENGDLVFPLVTVSGAEAVAQGIRHRITTYAGEWFLNTDIGVPWYQDILGQRFSDTAVRTAMRDAILSSTGVEEIIKLEIVFDRQARSLTIDWRVKAVFDDTSAIFTDTTNVVI